MLFGRLHVLERVRMYSSLIGQPGRAYVRHKLLQGHPATPELSLYLAS